MSPNFSHFPHFDLYVFIVGPLKTNCYFLVNHQTKDTLIIDPGDEGDFLSEQIINLQLKPQAIIFTHGHFDHVSGALPLFFNFSSSRSLPVFLHPADQFIYQRERATAFHFTQVKADPIIPARNFLSLSQFQTLLGSFFASTQIILTPGHTPGSATLYFPSEPLAFVGDLIFADGSFGRTDFSYGDAKKLQQSLALLKKKFSQDTLICPGHESPFTFVDVL